VRRILDDPVYVAAVLQVHRLLPDRQLHCRVEEEDPVISRPDYTPMRRDRPCLDNVTYTHEQEINPRLADLIPVCGGW